MLWQNMQRANALLGRDPCLRSTGFHLQSQACLCLHRRLRFVFTASRNKPEEALGEHRSPSLSRQRQDLAACALCNPVFSHAGDDRFFIIRENSSESENSTNTSSLAVALNLRPGRRK